MDVSVGQKRFVDLPDDAVRVLGMYLDHPTYVGLGLTQKRCYRVLLEPGADNFALNFQVRRIHERLIKSVVEAATLLKRAKASCADALMMVERVPCQENAIAALEALKKGVAEESTAHTGTLVMEFSNRAVPACVSPLFRSPYTGIDAEEFYEGLWEAFKKNQREIEWELKEGEPIQPDNFWRLTDEVEGCFTIGASRRVALEDLAKILFKEGANAKEKYSEAALNLAHTLAKNGHKETAGTIRQEYGQLWVNKKEQKDVQLRLYCELLLLLGKEAYAKQLLGSYATKDFEQNEVLDHGFQHLRIAEGYAALLEHTQKPEYRKRGYLSLCRALDKAYYVDTESPFALQLSAPILMESFCRCRAYLDTGKWSSEHSVKEDAFKEWRDRYLREMVSD